MSVSSTLRELGIKSPFSNEYVEPKKPSNYLKLTEGQHLFRIISTKDEVLNYFVEFVDTGPKKEKIIHIDNGDGTVPSPFAKSCWTMLVFDREEKRVKVWECAQKQIQSFLKAIVKGKIKNDWTKYDIQITRTGKGIEDTEYTVITGETEELSEEEKTIVQQDLEKIDILKMLSGEDPFVNNK